MAALDLDPFHVWQAWWQTARFCEVLYYSVFPDSQHDFVVSQGSQRGWLDGNKITQFGLKGTLDDPENIKWAIHWTVNKEDRVSDRAVELLNARTSDAVFAVGFQGGGKSAPAAPAPPPPPHFPKARGGIVITDPAPGTAVLAGGELDVVVEPVEGFVPDRVLAICNCAAEYVTAPPWVITLSIPAEALGAINLTAYALDAGGALAESESVPLEVFTTATLTGLAVTPDSVNLYDFVVADYLHVAGQYSDGVERDITSSAFGTTYQSNDPAIAIVDAEGLVRSVAVGETSITVTNGGHSSEVEVVVDGIAEVPDEPTTLFVRPDAPEGGDGLSWTSALPDLQQALQTAATIDSITEIWVAEGTYTPAGPGGDRYACFELVDGLALYGGFSGYETCLAQRSPEFSQTILSGDLNGDDLGGVHDPSRAENSLHVVLGNGVGATAVLDGFTITGGNADGAEVPDNRAGGMYLPGGSATVRYCRFVANAAGAAGGGAVFVVDEGAPVFINCHFTGNYGYYGGALNAIASAPTLINCRLVSNTAGKGAGIAQSYSSIFAVNTLFAKNSAEVFGGAMNSQLGDPVLVNCTLADNTAGSVGGLRILSQGSAATLTNCIFSGNSDDSGSGEPAQIGFAYSAAPDDTVVDYCCVQGWTGKLQGIGSFGADPTFIDTASDDYRLLPGSPCIDAADNTALPADTWDFDQDGDVLEPIPFDLDGYHRFHDDPGTTDTGIGDGPLADIGASEFWAETPTCPADLTGDGVVDVLDLLKVLAAWGPCPGCPEDLTGDDVVDVLDLLEVLGAWGVCD